MSESSIDLKLIILDQLIQRNIWEKTTNPGHGKLSIRRDHIVLDSLAMLGSFRESDIYTLQQGFKVEFEGESGVDDGGVSRDWFSEMVMGVFGPEKIETTKDFILVDDKVNTFTIPGGVYSPLSEFFYASVGRFLGLAILTHVPLNIQFMDIFWKSGEIMLQDIESDDENLYKRLSWIRSATEEQLEAAELFMVVNVPTRVSGTETKLVHVDIPIIPDGHHVPVTIDNREEFISGYLRVLYRSTIHDQRQAILDGFFDMVPESVLIDGLLSPSDINALLEGSDTVDVDDMKLHTIVTGAVYHQESDVIVWFWEIVELMTQKELRLLLKYITGDSGVPLGGFKRMKQPIRITNAIMPTGAVADERLPSSRACFNRLELPTYSNLEVMRMKLLKAIYAGAGFELV